MNGDYNLAVQLLRCFNWESWFVRMVWSVKYVLHGQYCH